MNAEVQGPGGRAPRPAFLLGRQHRPAPVAAAADDVLLWTADAAWAEPVRAAHAGVGLSAAVLEAADPADAAAAGRSVLVLDIDHSPAGGAEAALEAMVRLAERAPDLPAVVVVEQESVEVYRRALQHGMRHVVLRSEGPERVVEAVRAARRAAFGAATGPETKPAAVWVVFGAQGGVGKTTLATNLAAGVARRGRRAALLDLNPGLGAAHVFLDLQPRRSVGELLSDLRRLDADLLEEYMLRHATGLRLLPAPAGTDMASFVTPEHVQHILATAGERFDPVVVDLPTGFPEFAGPALRRATVPLLVATPDLAGMAAAQIAIAGAVGAQVDRSRIRLVLRHADRRHGLTPQDVETALHMPVWAHLPWDGRATIPALNRGMPAVVAHPRSRYAAAVGRLLALLDKERR